jgi:eukaryotic-like serine/threonine-protein kinase
LSNLVEPKSHDEPTLDAGTPIAIQARPAVEPSLYGDARRRHLEFNDQDEGTSQDSLGLAQTRLRVASLALGFGFFIFLLWMILHRLTSPRADENATIFVAQGFTTLTLIGIGIWLGKQRKVTMSCLRWCELLIFGLPSVVFFYYQIHGLRTIAAKFALIPVIPIAGWIILILTHSLFVPNTWRRVLVISLAIAILPLLATVAAAILSTPVIEALTFDLGSVVEMVLALIATVFIAVSSARMIVELQSQASEAKRLGRYRLKEQIGAGGMGEVYLAEHVLLRRPCAIKIIRPEKMGDPRALARFEREVQAASQLSHWNSIYIYDYGRTSDGTFFYVMEYLTGMSLQELVKKRGPMGPSRAIYLIRQVCEALTEAHQRQLIHRDVKPANIMVTELGGAYDVAKLLDFGLVKPVAEPTEDEAELTQVGTVTGSPLFMSPEQAIGEGTIDHRSDIYALGAVLYFMLVGRPPFEASSPMKILLAHARDEPIRPSQARSEWFSENNRSMSEGVSASLETVILKCLAKQPSDRYQSTHEMAEALTILPEQSGWDAKQAQRWWECNCTHYQASHG